MRRSGGAPLSARGPRLFFAVHPPAVARGALAEALEPLRGAPGAPRWTAPERWHLTLLFLGTVPAGRVPALVAGAGAVVTTAPRMTLRLAGGGRFGPRRRPQVAWVGLAGDVGPLADLAGRLAALARSLGLPVQDRPFRAHLTVGRWRPGRPVDGALADGALVDGALADRLAGYRGPGWPVAEVLLLASTLGPEPRYDTIAAWPVR